MENITNENFTDLMDIQKRIYEENRVFDTNIFNKGLELLEKEDELLAIQADKDLDGVLKAKAQEWIDKQGFLIGLTAFKQIYWNGYFRALIPYLIFEYINKGFLSKQLHNLISPEDRGKSINNYLFNKYPQLKQILRFNAQSYKNLLIELNKKDLKSKLGYTKNPDDVEELYLIPKTVIIDLAKQIERTRISSKECRIIKEVKKYKGKLNQKQIGEQLGVSQQTISRLQKRIKTDT